MSEYTDPPESGSSSHESWRMPEDRHEEPETPAPRPYYDEWNLPPNLPDAPAPPPEAFAGSETPQLHEEPDVTIPEPDPDVSIYDIEDRLNSMPITERDRLLSALDAQDRGEQIDPMYNQGTRALFANVRALDPNSRLHVLTAVAETIDNPDDVRHIYHHRGEKDQSAQLVQTLLERTTQQMQALPAPKPEPQPEPTPEPVTTPTPPPPAFSPTSIPHVETQQGTPLFTEPSALNAQEKLVDALTSVSFLQGNDIYHPGAREQFNALSPEQQADAMTAAIRQLDNTPAQTEFMARVNAKARERLVSDLEAVRPGGTPQRNRIEIGAPVEVQQIPDDRPKVKSEPLILNPEPVLTQWEEPAAATTAPPSYTPNPVPAPPTPQPTSDSSKIDMDWLLSASGGEWDALYQPPAPAPTEPAIPEPAAPTPHPEPTAPPPDAPASEHTPLAWPPEHQHADEFHVQAADTIPETIIDESKPDDSKPNGTKTTWIPNEGATNPAEPQPSEPATVEIPHPFDPKKYDAAESSDLPPIFTVDPSPGDPLPGSLTDPGQEGLDLFDTDWRDSPRRPGGELAPGGQHNPDEKEIILESPHRTPDEPAQSAPLGIDGLPRRSPPRTPRRPAPEASTSTPTAPREPRGEPRRRRPGGPLRTRPEAEPATPPTPEAVATSVADAEAKIDTLSALVKAEFEKQPEGFGAKLNEFFSKQPHLKEYIGAGLSFLSLGAQLTGFGNLGHIVRGGRTLLGMLNYTNLSTKLGMEHKLRSELPQIFERTEELLTKAETDGRLTGDEEAELSDLLGRQLSYYKQGVDVDRHHAKFESTRKPGAAPEATPTGEKKGRIERARESAKKIQEWAKQPETIKMAKTIGWYSLPVMAALLAPGSVLATGLMVATTGTSFRDQLRRAKEAKQESTKPEKAYEDTQLSKYVQKVEQYKAGTDAATMTPKQQAFTKEFAQDIQLFTENQAYNSRIDRVVSALPGLVGSGMFYLLMSEAGNHGPTHEQSETHAPQTPTEQAPSTNAPQAEHTPSEQAPAETPAEPPAAPEAEKPAPPEATKPEPEATTPETEKSPPPPLPTAPEESSTPDATTETPGTAEAPATIPEKPSGEPTIFTEGDKSFVKLDLGMESGPEKCEVITNPDGSKGVLVQWADIHGSNGVADRMSDHAVKIDFDEGEKLDVSNKFGYIVDKDDPTKFVSAFEDGKAQYTDEPDKAMLAQFSRKEDIVKELVEKDGGNWEETKARLGIDTSRHDWHDMVARTGVMASVDTLSGDKHIPDMQVHRVGDELIGNWHGTEIAFAPTTPPLNDADIIKMTDDNPDISGQVANSAFGYPQGSLRAESMTFTEEPRTAAQHFLDTLFARKDSLSPDTLEAITAATDTDAERTALLGSIEKTIKEAPDQNVSVDKMLELLHLPLTEKLLPSIPDTAPQLAPQSLEIQLNRLMAENISSPWLMALATVKESFMRLGDKIESISLVPKSIDGADVMAFTLKDGTTKQFIFPPDTDLEKLIPKGGPR